jgi:hypothetical protein
MVAAGKDTDAGEFDGWRLNKLTLRVGAVLCRFRRKTDPPFPFRTAARVSKRALGRRS